jgi:hypothetical protein
MNSSQRPSWLASRSVALPLAIIGSALLGTSNQVHAEDAAVTLCRSNPAYALNVIQQIVAAQLERDHDPALDTEPPDQMAAGAVELGVKECADVLHRDPATLQVLASVSGSDQQVAWDAFNTSCSDHVASRAACIRAEVGSVHALKLMTARDDPPGSKALVEACELVLKPDPAMADWRECVDDALAVHADRAAANRCKTSVPWHVTTSGADAGHTLARCLGGGK